MRRPFLTLASLAAARSLAGCGPGGSATPDADATLLLDGPPTGRDAGIYLAAERGFDEAEGIRLTIERPGGARRALRLLRTGRADAAILSVPSLARARRDGNDLVGVLAFLQRRAGPVLAVERTTLEDRRPDVEALVQTLQRGYSEAQVDPESAVQAIVAREDGVSAGALAAQLDAASPAFTAGVPAFGVLDRAHFPGARAYDRTLVRASSRD